MYGEADMSHQVRDFPAAIAAASRDVGSGTLELASTKCSLVLLDTGQSSEVYRPRSILQSEKACFRKMESGSNFDSSQVMAMSMSRG